MNTNSKLYLVIGLLIFMLIMTLSDKPIDNNDKLHELMEQNSVLYRKNDSLVDMNKYLDVKIDSIKKEKEILNVKLVNTKSEILIINKKRNEIPNYVKRLSANGVANELTKYLDEKTKSGDTIR